MPSVDGAPVPASAQAKVNGIVEKDAAKSRVPIHTFDPDASPDAKAAVAGKESTKLGLDGEAGGKEVAVDTGAAKDVVPTITIEDVDRSARGDKEPTSPTSPTLPGSPTSPTSPEDQLPGALPSGSSPEIPEWYKVGWRDVSGIDRQVVAAGDAKDKEILSLFLSEQFYGEWYHNAAMVIVAVLVTHFLTRFHFGMGWIFIVLAFCNTYYSTSMTRARRAARDDIQRELVKTRLSAEHEVESAEWLNNFLDRFWLIYEPVLSRTIVASVDQILSQSCPPFLDSLRLTHFTLGTKAPRIDKVKTFPRTEDDIVLMEWWLSFTPSDVSELTERQKMNKTNPKIILNVRLGKGFASAGMPILLEDMEFSGHMKIRMKLMTNFPHVQLVDLSFMEKPVFDYVLKPVGGETFGFDIANIPGLSSFIRETVHSVLGPMMYEPNVFTLNLEQMLSGEPIDTAIGVLQVTIQGARDLKASKIGGARPDPFVSLCLNGRKELATTKWKQNTTNPTWMETKFILINSLTESLLLRLWDYNDHRANTDLGLATFDLSVLESDATQENLERAILKDGKERGTLRFDVNFYPVLKPEMDAGGKETLADTKVGIVRLTVHQAKELDSTKSMTGDLNPFVKVYTSSTKHAMHATRKVKRTNNPIWEESTEFLCTDKSSSVIVAKVIDDRDFLKDPVIGYMSIRLNDLLQAKASGKDWWPLSGARNGKIRVTADWKPLNMAGSLHGVDQYVPPIGVIRLWLRRATDVKNVEATLGGKSDPYVRVQINNTTQGRTEVINNNLNPEWDQIIYIPVHSLKETMLLECMDYQHLTKDRTLGYTELKVSDLAKPSGADHSEFLYESTGKRDVEELLKQGNGSFKGKLHYVAEFVPAYAVRGIRFDSGPNELQQAAERSKAGSPHGSDGGTVHDQSDEEDGAAVPEGITAHRPIEEDAERDKPTGNGHRKSSDSTDSTSSVRTSATAVDDEKRPEEQGIEMSKEELFQHQAGVIIFNVLSGRLHKKARLEVLLDDAYWPAFSTVRARSTHAQWAYIGEGVVKELDFSRVWLRLNEADEGDKDDVIAEWKGDAKAFLQQTLDGPADFTLVDPNDEDKKSVVSIEARYLPVPIKLDPRESVNNQGLMRVDLLDGQGIHGIDRGGKSDPFVVFYLNGQKVYKSQTKKKTLAPEWNENFLVQVPSRTGANFQLEVFDWNQIEQAKSLGSCNVDLASLEPFTAVERTLALSSAKHGDKGEIRVRLLFTPEIIVKTRKNTSTFTTAGRAMTQIGHLPVGAGKGVIHGVTGVFRRRNSQSSDSSDERIELPAGVVSKPADYDGDAAAFPASSATGNGHAQEPGTLRVVVKDVKDLSTGDVKPYVLLRVGDKEHKTKHAHQKSPAAEWNESFTFSAAPTTQPKLWAWIYDHKTLGKDKLLGSAEIDIWQHLQPSEIVPAKDLTVELREGQGLLHLRLEYDPDTPLSTKGSRASLHSSPGERHSSLSPSRFSMSRRRGGDD